MRLSKFAFLLLAFGSTEVTLAEEAEEAGEPGEGEEIDEDSIPQDPLMVGEEDIEILFKYLDEDGNGLLEKEEYCEVMQTHDSHWADPESELEALSKMDMDGDGKLNFEEWGWELEYENYKDPAKNPDEGSIDGKEFKELFIFTKEKQEAEKAKMDACDRDKDGMLNAKEWLDFSRSAPKSLRMILAQEDFVLKDTDQDGFVSLKEILDNLHESEHGVFTTETMPVVDSDSDGKLDAKEYYRYQSGLYQQEESFESLLELSDVDEDKVIDLDELVDNWLKVMRSRFGPSFLNLARQAVEKVVAEQTEKGEEAGEEKKAEL